jgi:hypothetical protein
MKTTFSIQQVREYVEGWLGSDDDMQSLSILQVKAMLNNALVCLDDSSDGIFPYIARTSSTILEQADTNEKSVIP